MIEANKRNTEMKIAKIFIEYKISKEKIFSRNEIAYTLFVREKEFEAFKDELFDKTGEDQYKLKPEFYSKIEKWKKNHDKSKTKIDDAIKKYKQLFEEIQEKYNYREKFKEFEPLIKKLHWYFLPIYSDRMIYNRGVNPEDDIINYYDNFHSLQDLYKIIDAKSNYWKTLKGDKNLNHTFRFPVYTNRWGHEDIYKVTRKYNGWYVENIGISGICKPNGKGFGESSGGFVANFEQDYVQVPKSFYFIIERLWELADDTEMDIDELQDKLLDVARFISEVEKTIDRYTPDWYR